MNKRNALILNICISALSVTGLGFCAIQFAMAIRFMEIGRCLFYFLIASLCLETAVFSLANLWKKRK